MGGAFFFFFFFFNSGVVVGGERLISWLGLGEVHRYGKYVPIYPTALVVLCQAPLYC